MRHRICEVPPGVESRTAGCSGGPLFLVGRNQLHRYCLERWEVGPTPAPDHAWYQSQHSICDQARALRDRGQDSSRASTRAQAAARIGARVTDQGCQETPTARFWGRLAQVGVDSQGPGSGAGMVRIQRGTPAECGQRMGLRPRSRISAHLEPGRGL